MKTVEPTLSISPNNCYYPEQIHPSQETFTLHKNLTLSSSGDDLLNISINQNLIYNDTVSNFTFKVSSGIERVINVLTNAIISLKLTQDYNGTYVAYLSGQLSDDEFLLEANKYSYSPSEDLSLETLKNIKILFDATQIEFTPSDIADIFRLDHDKSAEAISKLKLQVTEQQDDNNL